MVKWFPPHHLPSAILKHNPSYTILVAHDLNITKVAKNYSGIESAFRGDGGVIVHEIPMADLEEGRLYYLAVKLVAGACYSEGRCYESASTAPVSLESPLASTDIVVPGSGMDTQRVVRNFIFLTLFFYISYDKSLDLVFGLVYGSMRLMGIRTSIICKRLIRKNRAL